MKHFVLGTAGHIDHGKTSLVKALTGIDTDRLPEEKARGISIDLGFAWLDVDRGTRVAVVDVPGHHRFVKTMLAGAAGIDFALLAVAADDSVMPQTREHLEILKLLNIKSGIVAVTKRDLVDAEILRMVHEDVKTLVAGSFLENADVVPFSAKTGEGRDALIGAIRKLTETAPARDGGEIFRMPVDRSFSVAGFGTVVTGTVLAGSIAAGENLEVLPRGLPAEVRGIQCHNQKVDRVSFGQRAALNLHGVKKDEIRRGDVLCAPGYFLPAPMVDAEFIPVAGGGFPPPGGRVKFHLGTSEADGRCYRLGNSDLFQFRLETPVVAAQGDRYILRDPGGEKTLGGGVVLDARPVKHKRPAKIDPAVIKSRKGSALPALIGLELDKEKRPLTLNELSARFSVPRTRMQTAAAAGGLVSLSSQSETFLLANAHYLALVEELQAAALAFHGNHPLIASGLNKAQVRQVCEKRLRRGGEALFSALWLKLCGGTAFKQVDGTLALAGHAVQSSAADEKLKDGLCQAFEKSAFSPPSREDVASRFPGARTLPALDALIKEGKLVRIEELVFARSTLNQGRKLLEGYLAQKKSGTVSDLRQAMGTTRKFAIPLLNYYEAQRVLRRNGDFRTLA